MAESPRVAQPVREEPHVAAPAAEVEVPSVKTAPGSVLTESGGKWTRSVIIGLPTGPEAVLTLNDIPPDKVAGVVAELRNQNIDYEYVQEDGSSSIRIPKHHIEKAEQIINKQPGQQPAAQPETRVATAEAEAPKETTKTSPASEVPERTPETQPRNRITEPSESPQSQARPKTAGYRHRASVSTILPLRAGLVPLSIRASNMVSVRRSSKWRRR